MTAFVSGKKPKSQKIEEAALSSVIQKLQTYKINEVPRITGAEVDELNRIIKEMREILKIMKKKRLGEVKRLNFLASDLVYVAHDILESLQRGFLSSLRFEMERMQRWAAEIKTRVAEMTKLSDNDGEDDDDDDGVQHVIGLEKDIEIVLQMVFTIEYIIDGMERDSIILIKGMPGVGKTTLARQIYKHADVVARFQHRAWVRVSSLLSLKEILIKLIQQVEGGENLHTSSSLEEMGNRSLLNLLGRHLQGKSCLIVLDDVPRQIYLVPLWNELRIKNNGSKLLLTSHMTYKISRLTESDVHKMEPLDPDKTWQLFMKTINNGNRLTTENEFPKHLELQGKQMLRRCGGLPLAIKEVGKQLVEKKVSGRSEWEQLLESVDFGSTLKLLEPFYKKLDPKVKSFFLYMAFYKENSTLRIKKLEQIWIAVGLMQSRSHGSSESVKYMECLTDESAIEVTDKITQYRMNPVLHMLSVKKAEEEIGLEILSSKGNNRPHPNPRHRIIICSRDKFNYSTNQDKHLVSLLFHGGGYFDASLSYWKSFQLLKILDFEGFGLKIFPDSISLLPGLTYLALRNNYIQEIPDWLEYRWKKLEVLDIAQNPMVVVCHTIWRIKSLVHLYMSDVICQKPSERNWLRNLRTLAYIPFHIGIYELLGPMYNLRKLGIEELGENLDVGVLFASLVKLGHVRELMLRGCRLTGMPCLEGIGTLHLFTLKLDGRLAGLPNSFPSSLNSLTLVDSCLDEDPMPVLEKLRFLKQLSLQNAYTGREMVITSGGFYSLRFLSMDDFRNLRNVQLVEGGMCRLKKLEINNCPYLDTLPEKIVWIRTIKEVKMVTTKTIATKIRNSNFLSKIRLVSINP